MSIKPRIRYIQWLYLKWDFNKCGWTQSLVQILACRLIGAKPLSEPMLSPGNNTLDGWATHAPDIVWHNKRGSLTFLRHWRINIYEWFSPTFLRIHEYKIILIMYYEKDMSNYVTVIFICIHSYTHMYICIILMSIYYICYSIFLFIYCCARSIACDYH